MFRAINRNITIGIRREQKGKWERRSPLVPADITKLISHPNCQGVVVQPSSKRIFSDKEYENVGCKLSEDLSQADVIMGIKEVPTQFLIPRKKYLFFSHTHKGQQHNMDMLKNILEKNIHLMDYELLVNDSGHRLVAFGRHAGYAGMINILHGLGHRFLERGYSTPFVHVSRAYNYISLADAKSAIHNVGESIKKAGGMPAALNPVVFAFTGDGNVSQGAQEVFQHLPHEYLSVDNLITRSKKGDLDNKKVYAVVVMPEDYIVHKKGKSFDRNNYFQQGNNEYTSIFAETILPHVTCLVHGSYWDSRYPRLITKDEMNKYFEKHEKLLAIADISCDLHGAIQFTDHASTIDDPFFYYKSPSKKDKDIMLCSIDNLPAELAREASNHFSKCLTPLLSDYLKGTSTILDRSTVAKDGHVSDTFRAPVEQALSASTSSKKKVLLLGSGRVALPIVDHFLNKKNAELTIASNSKDEINSLLSSSVNPNNARKEVLDVSNMEDLGKLIAQHDLVISFVPAFLHFPVAQLCVKHAKNLVTASYLSPEIAKLDQEAKKANIVILNELGLDPGIDHLLAMKFMDEVKQKGGTLDSFVSWCGGLPAPENSDNPFGYKFSWSPRGVLTASMNPAIYKLKGKHVSIDPGNILNQPFDVNIFRGFNFEGLPNRDSLKYADVYGLQLESLDSMFRGTLRYKGFAEVLSGLRDAGLLNQNTKLESSERTWGDVMKRLLKSSDFEAALKLRYSSEPDNLQKISDAFKYLGLFENEKLVIPKSGLQLDAFSILMEQKLKYEKNERDMVCLHHTFGVKYGSEREVHSSSLSAYGQPGGYTAMAKTVALPAAYGADLILEGKISQKGVLLPMTKEIYAPILEQLNQSLFFEEKKVN